MNKNSHQVLNQIISLVTLLSFVGWLPPSAIATDTFTTPDISGATSIEAPGTDGNNIGASDTHTAYVTHRFLATPVLKPITVDIEPACFNQDDEGVIPVGIFGSADLDVTQIDIDSLELKGLAVKMAGQSDSYPAHYEYINNDHHLDLIVQFVDSDGRIASGDGYATLTGKLNRGTPIEGKGTICIIP